MAVPQQQIRFASSPDGVRLAYAVSGRGEPTLIKAANWLSHLEVDWESPVWRHLLREMSARGRFVRYDERGCGLSDRDVADLGFDSWVRDLETVVDAIAAPRFALLGISQGAAVAIAYAVAHPERVSHLVLHGAYARGRLVRGEHAGDARRGRDHVPAGRARLGQGRPVVPPVLHHPVHPRRHARAAPLVQRAGADLDLAADRGPLHARVQRHRRHGAAAAGALPDAGAAQPARRARAVRRRAPDRQRHPRRALRADRQQQPPAARRASPAGATGSRRCAPSCPAPAPGGPQPVRSKRCRSASARSSSSSPRAATTPRSPPRSASPRRRCATRCRRSSTGSRSRTGRRRS